MADVILKIRDVGAYFHADEKIVTGGDTVKIEVENGLAGTFTVVFENRDSFFDVDSTIITKQVSFAGGQVEIGDVNPGSKSIKEYNIGAVISGGIPGVDAPPRIIRVA